MTNTDTEQLLELAASGDAGAMDQLLVRHRGRLKSMVAAHLDLRLAARIDPSDVVQDVLAQAAQRLLQYLADRPVAFYPWIRQMALGAADRPAPPAPSLAGSVGQSRRTARCVRRIGRSVGRAVRLA